MVTSDNLPSILAALAWPSVVLVFMLLCGNEIRGLLERLANPKDEKREESSTVDDDKVDQKQANQEFYWDWVKHEDQVFTRRGSFFLVGEAMLFAAATNLLTNNSSGTVTQLRIIYIAGLFVTGVWLRVNLTHVFVTQSSIKNELAAVDQRWSRIAEERRKCILVPNHVLMGIVLPSGIFVLWIMLWLL
jgi:hypothetical protein